MTCDRCQQPIELGGWPWCPHEKPLAGIAVIDDQLEGGPRHFETMGDDAPFISSKSEWRREVEARGLVNVDRHDSAYYAAKRKQHDEHLRDTGQLVTQPRVR